MNGSSTLQNWHGSLEMLRSESSLYWGSEQEVKACPWREHDSAMKSLRQNNDGQMVPTVFKKINIFKLYLKIGF